MKKTVLALGAIVSLSCFSVINAETLREAINHTVRTNPTVGQAKQQRLASGEALRGAYGGYLPSVDLHGAVGGENSNNTTTRARTGGNDGMVRRELGVQLRQMVFDGFATPSEVSRHKALVRADSWMVVADANDEALRATEAYINVLRQQNLVRVAQDNVTAHRRTLRMIEKRTASGITKKADRVQAQGRLALAQQNHRSALGELQQAKIAYYRTVGRVPHDLSYPHLSASVIPRSEAEAVSRAVYAHPRLKAANEDVAEAHYQHHTSLSANFPHVFVVLSANKDRNIDGVRGRNDDYSAMLEADWNIFRGGSDLARQRETAYLTGQAAEIRNNTRRQVVESTRLSWDSYRTNLRLMALAEEHMDASRATVQAYRKQFKLGQRTLLDLLDSEGEYFSARRSYLNAKYDVLFAKYRILNSMGLLLTEVNVGYPVEADPVFHPGTGPRYRHYHWFLRSGPRTGEHPVVRTLGGPQILSENPPPSPLRSATKAYYSSVQPGQPIRIAAAADNGKGKSKKMSLAQKRRARKQAKRLAKARKKAAANPTVKIALQPLPASTQVTVAPTDKKAAAVAAKPATKPLITPLASSPSQQPPVTTKVENSGTV